MDGRRSRNARVEPEIGILPRNEVTSSMDAVHGAFDYAELARLGLDAGTLIDFSTNSNPYGPSPAVTAALAAVDPACYPDRECLHLRRALADHLAVTPEQIAVGNGAAEILWLVAFAFLRAGDRALIVGPTFGEYARMTQLMGAQIVHWVADPADDFAVNVGAISAQIKATQPRLVFVCNPNNPTGAVVDAGAIAAWAVASPHVLFVVDEAYIAFADGMTPVHTLGLPNLISVRSMTKEYALAGLRLGYAVGTPSLIAALAAARPPWNVNAYAQAAGLAALGDTAHLHETLTQLRSAKSALAAGLIGQGYAPVPSTTNYFLLPVDNATCLRARLLGHGLVVRDGTSFGLPQHIRIATRRPEENVRLISALERTKDDGRTTNG